MIKKGISTILGTTIFLLVLVAIFSLFIFLIFNQTNATTNVLESVDKAKQNVLFFESYENNETYLVVSEPVNITYIIYPNGTVQSVNIAVHYQIPVSKILGNESWAIIVTNTGEWYNLTKITVPVIGTPPPK